MCVRTYIHTYHICLYIHAYIPATRRTRHWWGRALARTEAIAARCWRSVLYVCLCVYMYVCIGIHAHTHIGDIGEVNLVHVCVYVCMYTCVFIHARTYISDGCWMFARCVLYMYVHAYIFAYVPIFLCAHTYIHTHYNEHIRFRCIKHTNHVQTHTRLQKTYAQAHITHTRTHTHSPACPASCIRVVKAVCPEPTAAGSASDVK